MQTDLFQSIEAVVADVKLITIDAYGILREGFAADVWNGVELWQRASLPSLQASCDVSYRGFHIELEQPDLSCGVAEGCKDIVVAPEPLRGNYFRVFFAQPR